MSQQQKRATFEDVSNAQNQLRSFIDNCIQQNKVLTTQERERFIRLLQTATLGIGTETRFYIKGKQGKYLFGHVGKAAYDIAYTNTNFIVIYNEIFPIKTLWAALRNYLFDIYDHAIALAIRISQEQTRMGPSQPGEV